MSSETREVSHEPHAEHGTTRTYWIIGGWLFVMTALEIVAYYMEETLGPAAVPTILAISAAKFILVVMYYMHLKYDSKIFTGVFLFPMALAALVITAMTVLYHVLHELPR